MVEVIIGLVVCAVLASMIVTFMSSSHFMDNPVGETLRDSFSIYSIMEEIRLEYDSNATMTLATLKAKINNKDYGIYNVTYNKYVSCNASLTTAFTADNSTQDTLFVTISDPDQSEIKVSNIFFQ